MLSIIPQETEVTMSSLDFLNKLINPARESYGQGPIRNNDFMRKVFDEVDDLVTYEKIVRGNNVRIADLNYDQMILIGMRESKAVRKSVLAKLKELSAPKEDPVILLARQVLALDEENKRLAATKAQINDKRTATVMGRLGAATKKIKSLEVQLQDVGDYLSVTGAKLPQRVDTPLKDNVQSWRLLKQLSSDMRLPPKKVKDERYGEVLAYHVDVIELFKHKYI